jgi:tetratricopeptide (TPR) repeat protein
MTRTGCFTQVAIHAPQLETLAERQHFFLEAAARAARFWSDHVRQCQQNPHVLDAERDNILQAIAAAQIGGAVWQAAADLALAFHHYMTYTGLWRLWEQCLKYLLEAKDVDDQPLIESLLYQALAEIHFRQGRPAEAVHWAEKAVHLLEKLGDSCQLMRGLRDLAHYYFSIGRWDETRSLAQRVQALASPEDKDGVLADAFILYGQIALEQGQATEAIQQFESALEVADRPRIKSAANFMGLAYLADGRPDEALPCFQQALGIARAENDRPGQGVIRSNIGKAWLQSEQPDLALGYLETSLALTRETDNRPAEAATLVRLGQVHAAMARPNLAMQCFEQAIELTREFDLPSIETEIRQAVESTRIG